jgi:hypothetical protein
MAPTAPYNAASRFAVRSGVKTCSPSSNAEATANAPPTTSEADDRCDREKRNEVVNLKTEPRAPLPVGGAQRGEQEHTQSSHSR